MAKYVLVGNEDNKIRHDLEPLEAGMKSGGQGDVYFPANQNCIKVLHDPDASSTQLTNIAKILSHPEKLYEKVKSRGAVPVELVWDEHGKKIIGYTMESLSGWHSFCELLTEESTEALWSDTEDPLPRSELELSAILLERLIEAIYDIHKHGFVIGDFNPSNIMLEISVVDEKEFHFGIDLGPYTCYSVKIIDVDSWSVYRNDLGIEFISKVLDTNSIYHPDIIQADRENKPRPRFTQNHDWWAFSYIAWNVLTKYDPFVIGKIADQGREDRILEGHTVNRAATVRLHPDFGPVAQALGPKLRLYLDRCLKRKVTRPFPTKLMEDFVSGLRKCDECSFTAHASAIICPSCAALL